MTTSYLDMLFQRAIGKIDALTDLQYRIKERNKEIQHLYQEGKINSDVAVSALAELARLDNIIYGMIGQSNKGLNTEI